MLVFCWTLLTPTGPGRELAAETVFAQGTLAEARVGTDPALLGAVAASTAAYLRSQAAADPTGVQAGLPGELGLDVERTAKTLEFVAQIAAEDAGKELQRLNDSVWLAEHFDLYDWTPPPEKGKVVEDLRLTRYLVPQISGALARTSTYNTPLYAVPKDEAGPDGAAVGEAADLDRLRYTRKQVLDGVYLDGGAAAGRAAPLVWLTRAAALDAMMQGTVEVRLPDGQIRTYNVHRNNGRPYVRGLAAESQEAFWYFREVSAPMGWGDDIAHKIPLQPGVAVAGDVWNLGLGRLIALRWTGAKGPELRLVVLADSGGAFYGNLGQLDYFAGAYTSHQAMYDATKTLPSRVHAGLLVLKQAPR